jgi:catechol 2,3-dioxygenase-like lactoylglutathione lyase family enzyme
VTPPTQGGDTAGVSAYDLAMPRLDHINLCVPPTIGEEEGPAAEGAWLQMLGYRHVEPGPDIAAMTTVHWFEADDGTQVHLTVDEKHHPSGRAHTAIRLDDALDAAVASIEAAGQEVFTLEADGRRQVFANDPAGNLWELIGAPAS